MGVLDGQCQFLFWQLFSFLAKRLPNRMLWSMILISFKRKPWKTFTLATFKSPRKLGYEGHFDSTKIAAIIKIIVINILKTVSWANIFFSFQDENVKKT